MNATPQAKLISRSRPALAPGGDLLLAATIIGVVAMMVVPLPTQLIDLLITANLSLAIVLLLVSIYLTDALRIASFPSILLITTLFRLGLNVSSTRLILLQADAGQVIYSFGNFVVAGNMVVGAVIFLILTIIQFIVIAKGSERVAEVAARFTLDAMPGRQMAIDADVRAGAIDLAEARRLRGELQRESQFYGAMDGAMKFVKGDAIAGILITIINVVAGLAIGVAQRGMNFADAGRLYTILTIGDGLVSQIPALLISTAAGIVVTRVASEDEGGHLGHEISTQVLAHVRPIAITAVLLFLLAIVPGLPTIPFIVLGGTASFIAWKIYRRQTSASTHGGTIQQNLRSERTPPEVTPRSMLSVELGHQLVNSLGTIPSADSLQPLLSGLRELIYRERGVVLPHIDVREIGDDLDAESYRIRVAEIVMAQTRIDSQTCWVLGDRPIVEGALAQHRDQCSWKNIPGIATPVCGVPVDLRDSIDAANLAVLDLPTQIALHMGDVIKPIVHELVGIQETQELLDRLERTHPALVHELIPKHLTVPLLADVLQHLLEEQISIRNLPGILEALASWLGQEKDPAVLADYARMGMKRQITDDFVDDQGMVSAILLDPLIEQTIHDAVQRTPRGSYLGLEPDIARDIVQAVIRQWTGLGQQATQTVILTQMGIRRYVRRLIEVDLPDLAVVSYSELLPTVRVHSLARVAIERGPK